MVTRFFLFIGIILLGSCSNKLDDIGMAKEPYTGNELRIDGYYYSTILHPNEIFYNTPAS